MIARLLLKHLLDAVSPYRGFSFNVGTHVNEVADNACAVVDSGLMQKCPALPTHPIVPVGLNMAATSCDDLPSHRLPA